MYHPFINDNKILHVDKDVVTHVIEKIEANFGKQDDHHSRKEAHFYWHGHCLSSMMTGPSVSR